MEPIQPRDKYPKAKIEEPNLRLPKALLKPDGDPNDDLCYMKIFGKKLNIYLRNCMMSPSFLMYLHFNFRVQEGGGMSMFVRFSFFLISREVSW